MRETEVKTTNQDTFKLNFWDAPFNFLMKFQNYVGYLVKDASLILIVEPIGKDYNTMALDEVFNASLSNQFEQRVTELIKYVNEVIDQNIEKNGGEKSTV